MNKKQTDIGYTRTQEDYATPSHKHSNEASSLGFLPFFRGTAKIIMKRVNIITLRRGKENKKEGNCGERKPLTRKGIAASSARDVYGTLQNELNWTDVSRQS